MRRGARSRFIRAQQLVTVIVNRADEMLLRLVPPFIVEDPVRVRVRAGEQRGVARRSSRIRISVVAIREPGALVGEHAKATGTEAIMVALQVITAKLVNHNDDDQLRAGIVGGRKRSGCGG